MTSQPTDQTALRATLTPAAPSPETVNPPQRGWRRRLRAWSEGDEPERLIALAVLGGVAELFFILLTARFWLTRFFPGPAGVSLGFPQMMSGDWAADGRWLSLVLAAPFAAYGVALWYVRDLRSRLARGLIFGYALLFGATLLGLYPITAADLFHYLADARTLWVYHQNPMQVAPQAHAFVIGISWAQQPSPYGPFWQILSQIPVALTGDHWVAGVIGFKLLAMASYLACGALVFATVRRSWPGRELLAAMVFLWNPFVVFRIVGNGHNDGVMMAFALAAFFFVAAKRWRLALPLLALSVCIKYSTALIVPPVLLYAWLVSDATERRRLIEGAGLAALVTVAVFAPFWRGFDTFKTFIQNTNLVITAVPQLVALKLHPSYTADAPDKTVKNLGYVFFAVVYLAALAGIARRPDFTRLVAACAILFIAYLTACTWWFRPWYFLWFLSLTALLPSFWWTALAFGATLGATFFDLVEQYRIHVSWIWANPFRAYAAPVALPFAPLLLLLLLGIALTGSWTLLRRGERGPALDG